ncbi:putative ACR, YggU family [Novymonas esmeraldas]|uniref:ACR, YggU family n=1 Tax=Novymonas esmeraldas TaxID=1808958 RepID=A0AAW0F2P1_9TRYP
MRATGRCLRHMFPCLVQMQPGSYLLTVHAKPGARASAFTPPLSPTATVADLRIAAPPVDGQANEELLRYLDELVERGLRAMAMNHEEYVKGTCYAAVVAADAAASAAAPTTPLESGSGGVRKKAAAKKASSTGAAPAATTASTRNALPTRLEIRLVRGSSSREKTLLLLCPCTRAQLAAVLERESRE